MDHEQNLSAVHEPERPESLWDQQKRLTGELSEMIGHGAPQGEIDAKADQINRNVADLVDQGEVEPEDAWALGAGRNPHIDPEFDRRDF